MQKKSTVRDFAEKKRLAHAGNPQLQAQWARWAESKNKPLLRRLLGQYRRNKMRRGNRSRRADDDLYYLSRNFSEALNYKWQRGEKTSVRAKRLRLRQVAEDNYLPIALHNISGLLSSSENDASSKKIVQRLAAERKRSAKEIVKMRKRRR